MSWQDAKDYCASLQLGEYTGWRLPTLEEMKKATYIARIVPDYGFPPYEGVVLKGMRADTYPYIWTSTALGNSEAWELALGTPPGGAFNTILLAQRIDAVCTRIAEVEILEIAKVAQVVSPVPDAVTLKASIPLAKARLAYQAGQYQESIAQSQGALLIKPDFATAYWAIGISYGILDQWDLAITNLEAALKIDKNYGDAKDAWKWSQEGQKAVKKGKNSKLQDPQWNWTLEPSLCYQRQANKYSICSS
jgi:tetratricopeptide (TPR) repeat protein